MSKWLDRVGVWKGLGNSRMMLKVEGPGSKHLSSKGFNTQPQPRCLWFTVFALFLKGKKGECALMNTFSSTTIEGVVEGGCE